MHDIVRHVSRGVKGGSARRLLSKTRFLAHKVRMLCGCSAQSAPVSCSVHTPPSRGARLYGTRRSASSSHSQTSLYAPDDDAAPDFGSC